MQHILNRCFGDKPPKDEPVNPFPRWMLHQPCGDCDVKRTSPCKDCTKNNLSKVLQLIQKHI
jgi:hypothetical protein